MGGGGRKAGAGAQEERVRSGRGEGGKQEFQESGNHSLSIKILSKNKKKNVV